MPDRDGIPILIDGAEATELAPVDLSGKQSAFSEDWIQSVIFDHPQCVPIRQIESGFGTLISICRELSTPHGSIDNVLMTADGDIVIVEAKLWRNPQARREVVAQALDYAACLFRMTYEEFEAAILKARKAQKLPGNSLYEILASNPEVPDEARFADAVATNLSRGNIVVVVLGDGIRSEVRSLTEVLQSHAGFHFTFALVELRVFRTPGNGLLVVPGVLARTEMIERGIVRYEQGRLSIVSTPEAGPVPSRVGSISAEKFFAAMEKLQPDAPKKLQTFIAQLETIGAYPSFQKSLNFKWDSPSGKPVNLGYIKPDGIIWTDTVNYNVPHQLSHAYLEELARAFSGTVNRKSAAGNYFVAINGHTPKIGDVVDKLDAWFATIERFIGEVRKSEGG